MKKLFLTIAALVIMFIIDHSMLMADDSQSGTRGYSGGATMGLVLVIVVVVVAIAGFTWRKKDKS